MSEIMNGTIEAKGVLYGTLVAPQYREAPAGDVEWLNIVNKPFITIGENLKVENGALCVDVVDEVGDYTKPITASAVHTEIGNIDALLQAI